MKMELPAEMTHKAILSATFVVIILFSCSENPVSFSYEFVNQFTIERGSNAITVDSDNSYVYVSSSWSSYQKIQKFSKQGELIGTMVDYLTSIEGDYDYYNPIDLIVDHSHNIFVLAKPSNKNSDSTWSSFNGFCIMKYNSNGELQKEYDFADIEEQWRPSALSYKNGILYVTNGNEIKKIIIDSGLFSNIILPIQNVNNTIGPYIPTTDMAIDKDSDIWLVGQASFNENQIGVHVTKFDSTGQNYKVFNAMCKTSTYGAVLNNPGITFDDKDNLYLSTGYCQSIEIYDYKQEFQREIKIEDKNSLPIDIAIDKNNNLYVLDRANDKILVYKLD